MARKPKDNTPARDLAALASLNDTLYGTSGHLEQLIKTALGSTSKEQLQRTLRHAAPLFALIAQVGELMQEISEHLKGETKPLQEEKDGSADKPTTH